MKTLDYIIESKSEDISEKINRYFKKINQNGIITRYQHSFILKMRERVITSNGVETVGTYRIIPPNESRDRYNYDYFLYIDIKVGDSEWTNVFKFARKSKIQTSEILINDLMTKEFLEELDQALFDRAMDAITSNSVIHVSI